MSDYSPGFYRNICNGVQRSAKVIVPLVMNLVNPKSVVDLGCGTGGFLAEFQKYGIPDILGMDGEWARKQLSIPEDKFIPVDLSKPLDLHKKYDLVVSLEVAEHINPNAVDIFVKNVVTMGDIILFAAAIPGQGGVQHINEQWPEYWVRKFNDQDYVCVDCIREKIWTDRTVEFWYRQNILLFVRRSYMNNHQKIGRELQRCGEGALSLVHPELFRSRTYPVSFFDWLRAKFKGMV